MKPASRLIKRFKIYFDKERYDSFTNLESSYINKASFVASENISASRSIDAYMYMVDETVGCANLETFQRSESTMSYPEFFSRLISMSKRCGSRKSALKLVSLKSLHLSLDCCEICLRRLVCMYCRCDSLIQRLGH